MEKAAPPLKEWLKENRGKSINDYFNLYPPIDEPEYNDQTQKNNAEQIRYIFIEKKSILTSVLLTILFGPLGLFYSSVSTAINMLVAPVIALFIGLLLPVLCTEALNYNDFFCYLGGIYWILFLIFVIIYYPLCIILAITKVNMANKQITRSSFH